MTVYYNTRTDELGIAGEGWEYICLCKFVPVVRTWLKTSFEDCDGEAFDFVPHEIAEPFTDDWVAIGLF